MDVCSLSDVPDDLICHIGLALCPQNIYHVWNVLARTCRRFAECLRNPTSQQLKLFDNKIELPDAEIQSFMGSERLLVSYHEPKPTLFFSALIGYRHTAVVLTRAGLLHCDGAEPAFKNSCMQLWCSYGLLHRDGGLPAIETCRGNDEWWKYGRRHRENGLPAIDTANGYQEWWVNGVRHRDDNLAAVEHPDGFREYWLNGEQL